jgi:tetratricopeptide (TPR) repeat protein
MLAIPISAGSEPIAKSRAGGTLRLIQPMLITHVRAVQILLLLVVCLGISSASAQSSTNSRPVDFALRAKEHFLAAQRRYHAETNSPEAAWQYARACFDLGEFAARNSDRAEVAETGISVARKLATSHPSLAEAHYYLAMNMGQLARTKSLGALKLVDLMETEFNRARIINEKFDYAGPDRNLGLLYLEAPAFGSIGSRSKAKLHLKRAIYIAPDYPENRLILIEAYLRWGDETEALREFKALSDQWAKAQETFSGEPWTVSWRDWQRRFRALQLKLDPLLHKPIPGRR